MLHDVRRGHMMFQNNKKKQVNVLKVCKLLKDPAVLLCRVIVQIVFSVYVKKHVHVLVYNTEKCETSAYCEW